ncbi:MAG: hypothetical protein ACK5XX_00145 [Holosporales bacterium]|jgi:hypothetical protein
MPLLVVLLLAFFFSGSAVFASDNSGCKAGSSSCVFGSGAARFISQLNPSDTAIADVYGVATAINGDTAVIGAPWDSERAYRAGAVYIYKRDAAPNGWRLITKIFAPTPAARGLFGSAVAISAGKIIVGAPGEKKTEAVSVGAAYLYENIQGNWTNAAAVRSVDGRAGDFFGASVAFVGDMLAVGAHLADGSAVDAGAVYFFSKNNEGWKQTSKLQPETLKAGTLFGNALAGGDAFLAVGAYGYDVSAPGSGAVFMYRVNSGKPVFHSLLETPQKKAFAEFGWSVALSGNRLLVGAPYEDNAQQATGIAYVYDFDAAANAWKASTRLVSADKGWNDRFAASVALDGDTAVVGAPFGVAFVYNFDAATRSWMQRNRVVGVMPQTDALYSRAVSVAGGYVLVGAPVAQGGNDAAGAAYMFSTTATP